ncbi:MAG: glycine cleavage system aminomethyltransferase GcvT, partial [Bacteroidota bacterium]
MKHTAFYHIHKSYNARMVPFAGFEMPVEYEGVTKEHIAVRERVGVFDVSHMGEFWVKGPQAKALLQKVTTNDLNKIHNGKAQYTCFPNGKGGIVDDLIIYQFEEEKFMVVVNAANIEKDFNWLKKNNSNDVELENASDKISQLAIQGPKAMDVVQKITDVDLKAIPFFGFVTGRVAGIDEVIISATGYTGSGGVELYFDNKHAEPLWNALFDAGKAYDIVPVGLAARDTLRLEAGFCLYGNDIDDSTSPLEAGLGWITRFVDGNDFIDREYLSRQKEQGVQKKLVG